MERIIEMRTLEHQPAVTATGIGWRPDAGPPDKGFRQRKARLGVRLAFLVAGFGMACWAPLVPVARERLSIDEGVLGLLLLCLGLGSVGAMACVGVLCTRFGTRRLIVLSGLGMAAILPLLSLAPTPIGLGVALAFFGACLGSLDVAMNINALEVERLAGRPMMSGFHALYSLGGFAGAGFMTALLSLEVAPWVATLLGAGLMCCSMLLASRCLSETTRSGHGPVVVAPRGIVLLIAALAAITFLVEGAMVDWSALLSIQTDLTNPEQAGIGFVLFSVAMTLGRLVGDTIVLRLGDRLTVRFGGSITFAGFAILLALPGHVIALLGFVLIGLGASNIVPVLFRRAGKQQAMPAALAVSAVTTAGYAGVLLGPALIGFAAQMASLAAAFWLLAVLMLFVAVAAKAVTPSESLDRPGASGE